MKNTLLWLKNDLRLEDHRAFSAEFLPSLIGTVFIDDEPDLVRRTPRRNAFKNARLQAIGTPLIASKIRCRRTPGRTERELVDLCREYGATRVIAHQEVGDAVTFARDRRVAIALSAAGIKYLELPKDGLARGSQPMASPYLHLPTGLASTHPSDSNAPMTALDIYLSRLPYAHYRRDMWKPGPDRTASSRLSLHLACGSLSTDRVLFETKKRFDSDPRPWSQAAYSQFADRLIWRRGFVQNFETCIAEFPTGPMREERPDDAAHLQRWLAGETGVPFIDAAMRDLTQTGWVNFRLRQSLNSFAIDLLGLDPFHVGVALGELFDDYDPGIHWPQIMLQAGLLVDRGPRIVNPVKQGQDLDPDETWIRKTLIDLASVPKGLGHAPWIHDPVRYAPMIDLKAAARRAKERFPGKAKPVDTAQGSLL